MPQQRSTFGVNLLALFLLTAFLKFLVSSFPSSQLSLFLGLTSGLLGVVFAFGLVYAIFRALGARSEQIESFYQHFPLGLLTRQPKSNWSFGAMESQRDQVKNFEGTSMRQDWTIDWRSVFSFKYLRFAGILLVITSIFSLLFNIEWELIHKIIASIACGIIFIAFAEIFRSKAKATAASVCSLLGFTFFQFSLSLLYSYFVQHPTASDLPMDEHLWLALKLVLTFVFLFSLTRYRSEFQLMIYLIIGYVSPLTLLYVGAQIGLLEGGVFLLLMTALSLALGLTKNAAEPWLLSTFVANTYAYTFFVLQPEQPFSQLSAAEWTLVLFSVLFAVHLISGASVAIQHPGRVNLLHHVHTIAIHVCLLLGLMSLREAIPLLDQYMGIAFLKVSFATFITYIILQHRKAQSESTEVMLNLAIILSAVGVFLQVEGPWSSIVFLVYACGVLWYSLFNLHLRTRIYGFLILTVALVKLYLEFSDIFDSIPGTVAVLAIGLVLVGLSYKFEAIKDLVLTGVKKKG